jgi:hypothetical protein
VGCAAVELVKGTLMRAQASRMDLLQHLQLRLQALARVIAFSSPPYAPPIAQ